MKFEAAAKPLRTALAIAGAALPKKGVFPERSFLVEAGEDGLSVGAGDRAITIAVRVPDARVDESGRFRLEADRFAGHIAYAGEETVTAGARGTLLVLEAPRRDDRWKIVAAPAEESPGAPAGKASVTACAATLREALRLVLFAAHRYDSDKLAYSGCRWAFARGRLELACCDGDRAARIRIPAAGPAAAKAVVPARAMALLHPLLAGPGEVRAWLSGKTLFFDTGRGTVRADANALPFPAFEKHIPKQAAGGRCRADELLVAVRQADIADRAARRVVLAMDGARLAVRSAGKEGTAANPRHLAEFLSKMGSAPLVVRLADEWTVAFRYDGGDGTYVALLSD